MLTVLAVSGLRLALPELLSAVPAGRSSLVGVLMFLQYALASATL